MKVIAAAAGPGGPLLFTKEGEAAIRSADLVLTAKRLAQPLSALNDNVKVMGVSETLGFINDHAQEDMTVCVAASGDTGFYSIASTIAKGVTSSVEVEFLCGVGSLSYFAAKLKMGYEDMKLISLHGREKSIVPYVCYNEKVFALTGGAVRVPDIARQLSQAGLTGVTMYVGENLSLPEERIFSGTPETFLSMEFDDLAVAVIHNKDYVNRYRTLKDGDFLRGKSPMTKEAVRNLAVAALEIKPSDTVYDIGAGTGSVTCAMAMKACESMVYAVEKEETAVALVKENMEKTGARNIVIQKALAPAGLKDFPPADKVFIGGSTGNLKEIIETVLERNKKSVFVITAVTLETISQAVSLCAELDLSAEVTCVNVSTAKSLGNYHLMQAENPVYIIKGMKNE